MAKDLAIITRPQPYIAVFLVLGALIGLLSVVLPFVFAGVLLLVIAAAIVSLIKIENTLYPLYVFSTISTFTLMLNTPWTKNDSFNVPFHIYIVFTFLIWMVGRAANLVEKRRGTAIDVSILLLLFWASFSLIWARNLTHSLLQLSVLYLNSMAFYLLSAFLQSEETLKRMVRMIVYMGFFFTITGILSIPAYETSLGHQGIELLPNLFLQYSFEALYQRACGFAIHNLAASWYNLTIAIAFAMLLFPEKKFIRKWVLILAIAVMEIGIFLTKSRAGIFSQFPMVVFLLMMSPFRKRFIKWFTVFFVSFVLLYLVANFNDPFRFFKRLGVSFSTSASSEVTIGARLNYWKDGIEGAIEATYGIGGMGIGGFKEYYSPVPHSHSVYLSIFHDFGFVGVFILAIIMGVLFLGFYRNYKRLTAPDTFPMKVLLGFYGGMVALGLHSLIEFYYNSQHLWVFLGFGMAVLGIATRMPGIGQKA